MLKFPLPSLFPRLSLLVLALVASAAQAQVYRIVGPDGRVTFSDRPATSAAQPQTDAPNAGNAAAAASASPQLPFELRQVATRYPVTLYTTKDCPPCEEARSYLQNRGVPFSERTIDTSSDQSALMKLSGQDSLPFATIGNQHLKGFGNDSWAQYLNAAGYPAQSQLPKTYQAPAAKPLTTPAPVAAEKAAPAQPARRATAPSLPAPGTPTPTNPAGLSF